MTGSLFQFGERRDGYTVPVLNERAVRASAGILFALALVSFMNAWLIGNFQPTRIFVVGFLLDFSIRLFVNPAWAPSLVLAQWAVAAQRPEYVGAPQKRFAWSIGFVLALVMLYLVVINNMIGPINLIVCATCLTLLFFESAFGICIGCAVYRWVRRDKAEHCPGDACTWTADRRSGVTLPQIALVAAFAAVMAGAGHWIAGTAPQRNQQERALNASAAAVAVDAAEAERCRVPEYAKAMGHEEQWKLHNHCPP